MVVEQKEISFQRFETSNNFRISCVEAKTGLHRSAIRKHAPLFFSSKFRKKHNDRARLRANGDSVDPWSCFPMNDVLRRIEAGVYPTPP